MPPLLRASALIANTPRHGVRFSVPTKDPLNNPLNLYFSLQDEESDTENLLGIFSTRFLCQPISASPPKVSLDLLNELARQLVFQDVAPDKLKVGFFIEEWSYPDLAIRDEVTLNTAIYEILEKGRTRAELRMRYLPGVDESDDGETDERV